MLLMAIAGTTLTVAIMIRDLLTVANIGDCKAFLDDGVELVELTNSHRIEDNIGNAQHRATCVQASLCGNQFQHHHWQNTVILDCSGSHLKA